MTWETISQLFLHPTDRLLLVTGEIHWGFVICVSEYLTTLLVDLADIAILYTSSSVGSTG